MDINNIEVKALPDSELEISGEIAAEAFAAYRARALDHINKEVTLDGFRQGHAPEQVLVSKVGEEKILLEMAELAIQEAYPKIVAEKKLDVIGRPEISITKIAKDNPLGFKIKAAIAPEVKLPDYKALAKEINSQPIEEIKIEDKEVDEVFAELEKNKVDLSKFEDPKAKIRENLKLEKEQKAKDKKRLSIMEAIMAKSEIALPPVLIESELSRMLHELEHDIARMGLKFEDYLTHLKKSEADLRAAWRDDAIKRVKTSLILDKIGAEEKIYPQEEEIEKETKHLMEHYKNASEPQVRQYVAHVLINEKVWEFLEGKK